MIEEKIKQILQPFKLNPQQEVIWKEHNKEVVSQLSQLFKDEMLSIIGEDIRHADTSDRFGKELQKDIDAVNQFKRKQRSSLEEKVNG